MTTYIYSGSMGQLHKIEVSAKDPAQGLRGLRINPFSRGTDKAITKIKSALYYIGADVATQGYVESPVDGSCSFAIAIGLCAEHRQLNTTTLENTGFFGELGLSGNLEPVCGLYPTLEKAVQAGITRAFVPQGNAVEASLVPGLEVIPVSSLKLALLYLQGAPESWTRKPSRVPTEQATPEVTFESVLGNGLAKRALEIAAAGHHGLVLFGPPATGKDVLARALPSILPPIGDEAYREVLRQHSFYFMPDGNYTQRFRPFRAPHHTISPDNLFGEGGRGSELGLAHQGVIYLDSIELQKDSVHLGLEHRMSVRKTTGPDFLPLFGMGMCPCGNTGFSPHNCACLPVVKTKFLATKARALFSLAVRTYPATPHDHEEVARPRDTSREVQARVQAAIELQLAQQSKQNAFLTEQEVVKIEEGFTPEMSKLLDYATGNLQLRGYEVGNVVRVARTIADLAKAQFIREIHLAEAISFSFQSCNASK